MPTKVRLIFVNILPETPGDDWAKCVTDDFAINIAKGFVRIDGMNLSRVEFAKEVLDSLLKAEFKYTIRPCQPFHHHLYQMMTYSNMGFRLSSLTFHPDCTEAYKNYTMTHFIHFYSRLAVKDLKKGLKVNDALEKFLGEDGVLPSLATPPRCLLYTSPSPRD